MSIAVLSCLHTKFLDFIILSQWLLLHLELSACKLLFQLEQCHLHRSVHQHQDDKNLANIICN